MPPSKLNYEGNVLSPLVLLICGYYLTYVLSTAEVDNPRHAVQPSFIHNLKEKKKRPMLFCKTKLWSFGTEK